MRAQLSENSADQVAQFVCEVTVDTQAPSLDSDTFFTTMDDYVPGRNLLVHSSATPNSLRRNGNFITDFHAPTREEIPAYWQRYLPVPLCFHMHDYCQITKVEEGRILYIINNTQVEMERGDIIVINPNTIHSWLAVEQTRCASIGFYPSRLRLNDYCRHHENSFELLYSMQYPSMHISCKSPAYAGIDRCINSILAENSVKLPAHSEMMHNYIVELSFLLSRACTILSDTANAAPRRPETLQKAMLYISEHLDTTTGPQDVASYVHMNPCYFSYYFKRQLGIPCSKYIAIKRLSTAAELLKSTDLSISDIVFKCGFRSVSNFYQLFSSLYTISPGKFRKLHQ